MQTGRLVATLELMGKTINSHNAHIRYKEFTANFCGREEEGHFHYKNVLRALK